MYHTHTQNQRCTMNISVVYSDNPCCDVTFNASITDSDIDRAFVYFKLYREELFRWLLFDYFMSGKNQGDILLSEAFLSCFSP